MEPSSEQTGPLKLPESRGPTHAQLRELAEDHAKDPVELAGRYRLDRCVGKGGMARVYRARVISLGRPVAVKVLDDERGHQDNGLARFLAEAKIMARLRHPNVAEVLDLGSTREGVVYMVMELLEGEDLHALLRREGPLSPKRTRELILQICAGLQASHAAGIVHRDLKPANCYATSSAVKLLDFGIATHAELRLREGHRLTESGRIVGTPEYMSPEQARGDEVDERSDIYAAGILFGEMLTGRVPFEGKAATGVIAAQIYEPAPRLRDLAPEAARIPPSFDQIYARALAKRPEDRFASIAEFAEAIEAVDLDEDQEPEQRSWWRRGRTWLAAAVLTAACIVSLG